MRLVVLGAYNYYQPAWIRGPADESVELERFYSNLDDLMVWCWCTHILVLLEEVDHWYNRPFSGWSHTMIEGTTQPVASRSPPLEIQEEYAPLGLISSNNQNKQQGRPTSTRVQSGDQVLHSCVLLIQS
jgi:hypothetical protein